MKAVIIEDEQSAVLNLELLLKSIDATIQIVATIDTVTDAIDFFQKENGYDVIFMDIHLADGNSFEIFKELKPTSPIIFTTAYDQYAIQAFKVNSIDYLLKPIQDSELKNAIEKLKQTQTQSQLPISNQQMQGLFNLIQGQKKSYRQSFLVQKGDILTPIASNDFAFFYIQHGVVRGTTIQNVTYHLNGKLEDLENDLNPQEFYRANRQYLVQRSAIKNLSIYFNGRLIVNTIPKAKDQIIVSKANAPKFKEWLNLG